MIRSLLTSLIDRRTVAVRFVAVSVINVVNHQALLFLANTGWGWSGGRANVFAAVVAAVPGYFLSRQWVWKVRGAHSMRAEIVPFWTLSLVGLVVSSGLAEAADRLLEAWYWVAVGSLTGYFIVWVAKFFLLDRMFDAASRRLATDDGDAGVQPAASGHR